MEELPGALGTSASLALRLGQAIFAVASLLFMCLDIEFYNYTAFWGCGDNNSEKRKWDEMMKTKKNWEFRKRTIIRLCTPIMVLPQRLLILGREYEFPELDFLVTIMGLIIPWSLTLAVVDVFSVFVKRPARQPGILSIVVIGDWVLSFLSLAASCSTASVTSLLLASEGFCGIKLCTRYQLAAAMAFLSWFLSLSSFLFNLWLLPSM